MINIFIPICTDLYPTVFSFLLYTEYIPLQQCSKYSLQQKEKMEKYCQHIQPHGKVVTYYIFTKKKMNGITMKEKKKEYKENGMKMDR